MGTVSICFVFIVILSIICKYKYEINSITKPPPPPHPQGLLANPEFSNILKNSLFSQVNVSIGTAGVSNAASLHSTSQPCIRCEMIRSGDAMALGGEICEK